MSERMTRCPKCFSLNVKVLHVHNPDTTDMNAQATLFCEVCMHEWEDQVTSKYTKKQRKLGYII